MTMGAGVPAIAQQTSAPLSQLLTPTPEQMRPPATPAPGITARVKNYGAIPKGPCPTEFRDSPLTFDLETVDFVDAGDGVLPPPVLAALAGIAERHTGSRQPIGVVCALRDEANYQLSRAGFIAAVQVPVQTIADGRLKLRVITARIVELRLRGQFAGSGRQLAAMLERLKALYPLNERDAERILLLASDIPGTAVTLALRPSADGIPGNVVAELAVEQRPGDVLLNAQNMGSREIGRYSLLGRAELYGLTGLADRTFVSGSTTTDTSEQQVAQFGHDFALTRSGLRLAGVLTHAWTKPSLGAQAAALDFKARSLLWSLDLRYPLVRKLAYNLVVDGGLESIDQRVGALGRPYNLDKLRVAVLRFDADATQRLTQAGAPAWRVTAHAEIRKGLTILGSSHSGDIVDGATLTRFEGNPQAWVIRGETSAEARLPIVRSELRRAPVWAITGALAVRGQWTPDPLLAFEEFSVGNLTLGRGYDPGSASGDRALGFSGELRLGKPAPLAANDLAGEVFAFYDQVHIWNLDTGSTEANRTVRSVGGGIRLILGGRGRLDLVYAHPLDKAQSIDTVKAGDRLLATVSVRAWP